MKTYLLIALTSLVMNIAHAQGTAPPLTEGCWPNCQPWQVLDPTRPPATEDEARDLWCKENPGSAECLPSPGGLPLPPCWPYNFSGTGSIIYSKTLETGNWHYWFCPMPDTSWKGFGLVLGPNKLLIHPRSPRSTPSLTAGAYWALNAFVPTTPEEKATEAEMKASMAQYVQWAATDWPPITKSEIPVCLVGPPPPPPPPPPAPKWVVAKNSTFTTRPAYFATGGILGTKEGGRAPVGASCDPVNAIIKTSTTGVKNTYAVFGDQTSLYALCVLVK